MIKKNKLIIIRHGNSIWNKENKFTGWADVSLSKKGNKQSIEIGKFLKKKKILFDIAFTSVLKRSIHTLWNILNELNLQWIPIKKTWMLNEKHYGKLEGLNKNKAIKKYGIKKIHKWRKTFKGIPPKLNKNDNRHPINDIKYNKINKKLLPSSENLKMVKKRVSIYWKKVILKHLKKKKKIIIVSHKNLIKTILILIDKKNKKKILNYTIKNCKPIIYTFDKKLKPIKFYTIKL